MQINKGQRRAIEAIENVKKKGVVSSTLSQNVSLPSAFNDL
jgi:hypothetical protein